MSNKKQKVLDAFKSELIKTIIEKSDISLVSKILVSEQPYLQNKRLYHDI